MYQKVQLKVPKEAHAKMPPKSIILRMEAVSRNGRFKSIFGLVGTGIFFFLLTLAYTEPIPSRKVLDRPSLSARFQPVHLIPEDVNQLKKFKILASGFHSDSTHHYSIRSGRLEISYDLLQDLHAGTLSDTGADYGSRLTSYLGNHHGLRFQASGSSFGVYTPDDEWYANSPQWALHNTGTTIADRPGKAGVDINVEKVWDKFGGSDSLIIAVVDAGFGFQHPELKSKNWRNMAEVLGKPNVDDDNNGFVDDSVGWDFVDNDNFPDDFNGHGTNVSSVIAAAFDNGKGIAGVVPQCRIMPIRVLDASGMGKQDDIAKGIMYAINNGARVINFSIGGDVDNAAMRAAFQAARDKGVPIVVAAGNDGQDIEMTPSYPASYTFDNLLVVAAHDHAGLFCGFSNFGKTSVDIAAPGELVLVAGLPNPLSVWKEGFEATGLSAWTLSVGAFALSTTAPIVDKQSLTWVTGSNVTATSAAYIDLTGREGCMLKLQATYHPANAYDALIIEGNAEGSALWTTLGVVTADVSANYMLTYGLQGFDGVKFKLRFRTSAKLSSSGRILKIDGLEITAHDPNPIDRNIYKVVAGTSIAAPHMTGYVAMQRVACDRMGLVWNRTRALAGVVQEPAFTGKVATGGRLDILKGLQFYLSTLPDFHVMDSSVLSWRVGDQVRYTLDLTPVPVFTYQYSLGGLGTSAIVDGAGKVLWVPAPNDTGMHIVTLTATGPTVLRKRFNLQVLQNLPVRNFENHAIKRDKGITWWLGGQGFLISPEKLVGRHWVEIQGMDALGKVQVLKKAWMEPNNFMHPWEVTPIPLLFSQIQVSVDGLLLPRDK